jgi:hypothetical protein
MCHRGPDNTDQDIHAAGKEALVYLVRLGRLVRSRTPVFRSGFQDGDAICRNYSPQG